MTEKTIRDIVNRQTTHVTGMFAIHADGSFLNGGGLGSGEDKNKSMVKQYWTNKPIPYVSSQSWRRWLRDTLIEETGWEQSIIEAIAWNNDGNTKKVAGQLNPIKYPEDDLFGYMFTSGKDTDIEDERVTRDRLPKEQIVRTSPFKSSLLSGVPSLTHINEDEGYVHLENDTPVPYTTQFMSGELTALFGLELYRVGVFEKRGNASEELDPELVEEYSDDLTVMDHPVFVKGELRLRKDLREYQDNVVTELIKSLALLRGGSKQTQFNTDVSPRLMILAGLNVGNQLFDDLLYNKNDGPALNIDAFMEIVSDYAQRFTTPVFIGLRTGYLTNEDEVRQIDEVEGIKIQIGTPQEVAESFCMALN